MGVRIEQRRNAISKSLCSLPGILCPAAARERGQESRAVDDDS